MKLYRIKKSKIDKKGLYANQDIKKGTRIIEYKGKVITIKQAEAIAKEKMKDLNAFDLKEATKIICGSARSMGIEVKE